MKGGKTMSDYYEIIPNKGHYKIFKNGEFICSADDEHEAEQEIVADKESSAK